MSASTAVLAGRARAEARMVDAGRLRAITNVTTDPVTGQTVGTLSSPLYDGPIEVQSYSAQELNPETPGVVHSVQRYVVKLPVGAARVEVGHIVDIDVCHLDPHLVGRRFRIVGLFNKTYATAQRCAAEVVT